MRCLFLSLAIIPAALTSGCHTHPQGVVIFGEPTVVEVMPDPKEEKCLATMVYGEARGEPELGQVAVAYTAVNRAVNRSVCDVVLAPKQYSIFNDNPTLKAAAMSLNVTPKHKNVVDEAAWPKAMEVARAVLRKAVPDPTKGSTHYLAPEAMAALGYEYPEWSKQYRMVAVIHGHKFYKYAPPKKEKRNVVASI
jgi:spore germination cell wall hydrolase CwlJ-like protein